VGGSEHRSCSGRPAALGLDPLTEAGHSPRLDALGIAVTGQTAFAGDAGFGHTQGVLAGLGVQRTAGALPASVGNRTDGPSLYR